MHRAFLKAHTCPRREAQWRSRAKRNKCRRPSAASYAGFVLERNEASCFGVAGEWAWVVFHEGLSSHWECRRTSNEHSLLSARLLARKAPGDLFESRKENAVSSSNRTFFSRNAHGIFQTRDIRDKIEAVKFSSLVRSWSGGFVLVWFHGSRLRPRGAGRSAPGSRQWSAR